ncbi:MAG: hypothetical protein H2069_01675 [Legionella sp.]|nr:hypothetical protein [Legionella sp.]
MKNIGNVIQNYPRNCPLTIESICEEYSKQQWDTFHITGKRLENLLRKDFNISIIKHPAYQHRMHDLLKQSFLNSNSFKRDNNLPARGIIDFKKSIINLGLEKHLKHIIEALDKSKTKKPSHRNCNATCNQI